MPLGKLDQRARCAVSVKANMTALRWVSVRVARKAFVAVTAAAVVVPALTWLFWAKAGVEAVNCKTACGTVQAVPRMSGSAAHLRRMVLFKVPSFFLQRTLLKPI